LYDCCRVILLITMTVSSTRNKWSIRPALSEYWEAIRNIRNDQRYGFKNTSLIDRETHKLFMQRHSQNYRVAVEKNDEYGNERVIGFVGIVGDDGRLATHEDYKGRGVATFLWSSFAKECPPLTHSCRRDNLVALALNRKFGYVPDPKDWESGSEVVRLIKKQSPGTHNNRHVASKL